MKKTVFVTARIKKTGKATRRLRMTKNEFKARYPDFEINYCGATGEMIAHKRGFESARIPEHSWRDPSFNLTLEKDDPEDHKGHRICYPKK